MKTLFPTDYVLMKPFEPPERLKWLLIKSRESRVLMIPVPVASILLSSIIAINATMSSDSSANSTTMLLFGAS